MRCPLPRPAQRCLLSFYKLGPGDQIYHGGVSNFRLLATLNNALHSHIMWTIRHFVMQYWHKKNWHWTKMNENKLNLSFQSCWKWWKTASKADLQQNQATTYHLSRININQVVEQVQWQNKVYPGDCEMSQDLDYNWSLYYHRAQIEDREK